MKGIIITGGEFPVMEHVHHEFEGENYIIAPDSGLDTAFIYGIFPDLVVGDMDSVKNYDFLNEFTQECVKLYPKDKDETDTEIALRVMGERGLEKVVIIGGGGGRMDHLLGIAALFDRKFSPSVWYTKNDKIVLIDDKIVLRDMAGEEVSFFPVGNDFCRAKTKGLKWPLDDLVWKKGDSGLSNIICEDLCKVSIESGRLIMILHLMEKF